MFVWGQLVPVGLLLVLSIQIWWLVVLLRIFLAVPVRLPTSCRISSAFWDWLWLMVFLLLLCFRELYLFDFDSL